MQELGRSQRIHSGKVPEEPVGENKTNKESQATNTHGVASEHLHTSKGANTPQVQVPKKRWHFSIPSNPFAKINI